MLFVVLTLRGLLNSCKSFLYNLLDLLYQINFILGFTQLFLHSHCKGTPINIKWKTHSLIYEIGNEYVKNGKPVKFKNMKHISYKLYKCNETLENSECRDTKGGLFFKIKEDCFLGFFDCIGGAYSVSIDNRTEDDSYIILNVTHQGKTCRTIIILDKNEPYGYKDITECESTRRCKGPTFKFGT